MKKIVIFVGLLLNVSLYGGSTPLVDVAGMELDFSKNFLQYERYQQRDLYAYVKLLKSRFVLTREEKWVVNKIVEGIYLESQIISIRKDK